MAVFNPNGGEYKKIKMLINRNNYETFFLLYADDELRADERKAVEDFVAENKDLKGELNLLIAAILPAEEIVMTDKSFLYRAIVFNAALQEKLLLKIDNELSAAALENVNNILATNNEALQEYNSLLGTKLNANDKIVFEEKHLLYKKEKDNVIAFRWVRWAAAAVLIGFGIFFGIAFFSKKEIIDNTVAVIKTPENNNTKQGPTVMADTQTNTVAKTLSAIKNNRSKNQVGQNIAEENIALVKKEKTENLSKEKNIINNIQKNKEEVLAINKTNEKTLPLQKIVTNQNTVPETASLKITEKHTAALASQNIEPLENTYAQVASFTDAEKNENKIFYIDEDELKRSKIGGFFKKVKRMVERTAKIKTGNSISIAGFEIASK